MVLETDTLAERRACEIVVGDRLPLLCALPTTEESSDAIDLIDRVDDDGIIVQFPSDWHPTPELRKELVSVIPRADARHRRLRRRELPRDAFLAVEHLAGAERSALRLRRPRSTSVPALFPLDADTARLLGYYLAEGCCSRNGTTSKIIWTFGRSERDAPHVEDVCGILDRLHVRHRREERESTIAITVSSRIWGTLIRDVLECGCRSFEKRIPHELLSRPDLSWEALKGVFRGDGSVQIGRTGSPVRISHATTSRALHDQLLLLLQSRGIVPYRHSRKPSATIQGRAVASRQVHQLEVNGCDDIRRCADLFPPATRERILAATAPTIDSPFAAPAATRYKTLAAVAVTSIEVVESSEAVYDLEVPGSHLFVTSGGVVTHNCIGVANVGGECAFDEAYAANPLVNALCVGLLPTERVLRARATGVGNAIVLYGAFTCRDGIGGGAPPYFPDLQGVEQE